MRLRNLGMRLLCLMGLAVAVPPGALSQSADGGRAVLLKPVQLKAVASAEPGWPQWRGPRRDGISDETGLLPVWPAGGPPRLWTSRGLGNGYSSPVIAGGRLFITGDVGEELHIFALDLAGRKLWQSTNGAAWKTPYPGARASCTVSEGRVYHMNAHGRVVCLDAATGLEIWGFQIFERFGGKNLTWAVSENLLVDGSHVIVTPGGSQALMAALDKRTGETVWKTEPLRLGPQRDAAHERMAEPAGTWDNCSYASPILVQNGARREIVSCSLRHVFAVDAQSGKLLWTRPFPTRYSVIAAAPVLTDEGIFVTAPDTPHGGKLFRRRDSMESIAVETAWTTPLDTCHGGVVYRDGTLYGSWYRQREGWAAVEARTGQVRFERNDLESGSVLWADGRLYCLAQNGEMLLLSTGEDNFAIAGRFRLVPEGPEDVWAHPVILDHRLYLRYHDTLRCYALGVGLLENEP